MSKVCGDGKGGMSGLEDGGEVAEGIVVMVDVSVTGDY